MSWSRRTAALLLSAVFAACGGSKPQSGFSAAPTSISFAAGEGEATPPAQAVRLTVTNPAAAYVGAAFDGTPPSWLQTPSISGSGSSWTLSLQVSSTALPPGTYRASLKVGIADQSEQILAVQDIAITYVVRAVLRLDAPSLSFSYVSGAPPAPAQAVGIRGTGLSWTASANQAWIGVGAASGQSPGTLAVSVDPAGLAPGRYTGAVTLASPGGPSVTVEVQLTVSPPAIAAGAESLSFSGVNGAPIPTQPLAIALNNGVAAAWSAVAADPWVVLVPSTGTVPDVIAVGIDASKGPLASGTHGSTITVTSSYQGVALTRVIPVSLTLTRPTLAVTPSTLILGGADGRDLSAQRIQVALDTGSGTHSFTASTMQPWLALPVASGAASGTPTFLEVGANPGDLAAGSHSGSLTLTATVNGDELTLPLPVTLNLDSHRLLASDTGVAFASMPQVTRTARTLQIRDSFGATTSWTATSDQAWLAVTPGGTAPGELTLIADPAGLAADTVHRATVTIASTGGRALAETVQVGLWIGPAPQALRELPGAFKVVQVDPVRPYAYAHTGGTDISVYNIYTGAAVATLARVAPQLGSLAVSGSGQTLFAEDLVNHMVVPIDLATGAVGTPWPLGVTSAVKLVYARTNGKEILLANSGHVFDAATGAQYSVVPPMYYQSDVASDASVDGTRFCVTSTWVSPQDVWCHSLDYTVVGDRLLVGSGKQGSSSGYGGDLALSADGTRVYRQGLVFDATTMAMVQTFSPQGRSLEVTRDGRVIAGAFGWYEPTDIWVRDRDGLVLGQFKVAGYAKTIVDGQMKATGEGLCVAAITDDPKLVFQVIGP